MIQMRPLDWASQYLGVPEGKLGKKDGSSTQNLLKNLIFWQNWSFPPFVSIFSPNGPPNIELPNQVASFVSFWGLWIIKKGQLLVFWWNQLAKMGIKIQLCQISIQIQMPQNEFKNAKFNNPDIDNQMSGTCGQYEPLYNPWNVFYSCVTV